MPLDGEGHRGGGKLNVNAPAHASISFWPPLHVHQCLRLLTPSARALCHDGLHSACDVHTCLKVSAARGNQSKQLGSAGCATCSIQACESQEHMLSVHSVVSLRCSCIYLWKAWTGTDTIILPHTPEQIGNPTRNANWRTFFCQQTLSLGRCRWRRLIDSGPYCSQRGGGSSCVRLASASWWQP